MTRTLLAALLAIVALPAIASSQSATESGKSPASAEPTHDVRECWRFGFGRWEPALDWLAAGHQGRSPEEYLAAVRRGEASRPSAPSPNATWSTAAGDTTLLLFPDWWPAGVAVRLDAGRAAADTLRGTATALVADGHRTNPVSRIVAIRRSCGAAPPP